MSSQNHRLVVWFFNILPKITKVSFLLFILSLFFPLRKVFFTNSAYLTGAYSDFTSFSLYLSDILLFITWWSILISRGGARDMTHHVVKNLKWLCFWLILAFLWHFKTNSSLNWYFLLKYAELIVAYGTTVYIFTNFPIKQTFLKLFVFLGSIQSFLALSQFLLQKSIGLKFFGENLLNPSIIGVAKIVSGGTKYIRGYGTFPHPNLLSAFLVVSIFFSLFLIQNSKTLKSRVFYSILLFVNILGLTITFSRGAFFALGIGLVIHFGLIFLRYRHNNFHPNSLNSPPLNTLPSPVTKVLGDMQGGEKNSSLTWMERVREGWCFVVMMIIISVIVSFVLFRPFLLSRATISDQATLERKEYNQIGIKIIKDKPFFGIGIGESVLHMKQYSPIDLNPWQIQPIHNYFLLAAAELGIPGALILIWIFLSHLKAISYKLKAKLSPWPLTLSTILVCLLILMLFDHYLYTLEQTQMLLWVILGIIAAKTNLNNKT